MKTPITFDFDNRVAANKINENNKTTKPPKNQALLEVLQQTDRGGPSSIERIENILNKHGVAYKNKYIFSIAPFSLMNTIANALLNPTGFFDSAITNAVLESFRQLMNDCDNDGMLKYLVKDIPIPGRTVLTQQYYIFSKQDILPYSFQYSPLTVTYMCTADMKTRKFFDYWQSMIMDNTNWYSYYFDEFATNAQLDILDENNNIIDTYIFEGIYPVTVGEQRLSYDSKDLQELSISFNYYRWYKEDIEAIQKTANIVQSGASLLSNISSGLSNLLNLKPLRSIDYAHNEINE
jgi:hypothetical protein